MTGHRPAGRHHGARSKLQPQRKPAGADRDAYRHRLDEMADSVAFRVDRGRDVDDLAEQIRGLMAQLRDCQTPAQRAAIEAKVRPLVQQRQYLTSRLPWAV